MPSGKLALLFCAFCACCAVAFWPEPEPDINDPKSFEVFSMDIGNRRRVLTVEDMRLDLRYLIEGFRRTYAGQKVKPQEFEFYIKYLERYALELDGEKTTDKFASWLDASFLTIGDGHLMVEDWYRNTKHWEMNADQTVRAPSSIAQNRFELMKAGGKKIAYYQIKTFRQEPLFEDGSLFEDLAKNIKEADAIILDLRGNAGGFGYYSQPITAMLWGKQYLDDSEIQAYPSPVLESGTYLNEWTKAMTINMVVHDKSAAGADLLKQFRRSWFDKTFGPRPPENFPPGDGTRFVRNTVTDGTEDLASKGFNKPIILIVDNGCASACEIVMEDLEQHPFAKTIGQTTMGATQFRAVAKLILPKSHLVIQIPTSYVIYKDKRQVETFGYTPKYPLKESENPIAFAKKLILEKKKPGRTQASVKSKSR